jgi:hypothetical protein
MEQAIDPNLIWQAYRLHLKFNDDSARIAEHLGISESELQDLYRYEPFANAARAAQADRLPACFESLSDEAKDYWHILNDTKALADAKQSALLAIANNGERERQRILAYGLMQNFFDVQAACKALNVPVKQFNKWVASDPEFADMIAEVQASKRFFVEGQLFKLIALGSEKATMFAAERLMPKEYGNKVQHSGSIEHNHTHTQQLDLANLPTEVRGKIFELLMEHSGFVDPDGLLAAPTLEAASVKRIT